MRTLIASYDKLKGKFNSFAAKCLSEKQKRESGMILQAPPLLMPYEKEAKDREEDIEEIKTEGMVARGGARMERVDRKEVIGRQGLDDEDVDDEPEDIEEGSIVNNPITSKKFEREPEREPEMSGFDLEGNITHSILENE